MTPVTLPDTEIDPNETYGTKHLIQCQCILPQFKSNKIPVFHNFAVFSQIKGMNVVPKFVQCSFCGTIHKVTNLCISTILPGKENMSSVITIEDVKLGLSSNLVSILENYDLDVATWENVQYIVDNEIWGDYVMLASDVEGDIRQGKIMRIISPNLAKIETFVRNEEVKRG